MRSEKEVILADLRSLVTPHLSCVSHYNHSLKHTT